MTKRKPHVQCECGHVLGQPCEWSGNASDLVLLEWMPVYLRASHEAAGNAGTYPHNGAMRLRVTRECAKALIEGDEEWAWLV